VGRKMQSGGMTICGRDGGRRKEGKDGRGQKHLRKIWGRKVGQAKWFCVVK
jgi:hypothetical protein